MSELASKHKVTLSTGLKTVEAPLPPDFGLTVGSEYSTPFDTGSLSGNIQKLYALGGISNPVGLRMRKMYTNPEPTEISFDMEFAAYYSAKEEVALPMVTLMTMALGRIVRHEDIEAAIEFFGSKAAAGLDWTGVSTDAVDEATDTALDAANQETVSSTSSRLLEMIQLIRAPELCVLKFGDLITIPNVYITSTAAQFSNVLDKDGFPMSGTVSVTCTLQVAPVADNIIDMFGKITGV
tara:strand:- start:10758 stop:11471 length:714 start_codon:yes stop_codon:yes gene_type:complete